VGTLPIAFPAKTQGALGVFFPYFMLKSLPRLPGSDGVETCLPFWIITPRFPKVNAMPPPSNPQFEKVYSL
jgi:hypothetical protein